MALTIINAAAKAAADAIAALVDGGPAAGKLKIYAGTPPADVTAALSGNTLLAELTMSDPAFSAATDAAPGGLATANAITSDPVADATGAATFYRIEDSTGAAIMQGNAGDGGGENLVLANANIQAGVEVAITSLTVTMPEA